MKETKSNILSAAINLFNESGFGNVRLQHIADYADMSIGNLAYHFATKQDILENIYKSIVKEQRELIAELNLVPLFENLDRHWENAFKMQLKYAFFYQDTLEIVRYSETIRNGYQEHIIWEKEQFVRLLQFNVSRGALVPIDTTEETILKAEQLWLIENSYLYRSMLSASKVKNASEFKDYMWMALRPHFSEIGKQEYEQLIKFKLIPL
ncbi:MAG: TetR family transcriptional regulator [Cyclobacteriaceae bacterium]